MKYLAVDIGTSFFGNNSSPLAQLTSVGDLVSLILKISFVIAGVLILFFMVVAGFQMVAGAGTNNPESAKKGKEAASAAVIGFVIVFVAYWIVRIIEIISGLTLIS